MLFARQTIQDFPFEPKLFKYEIKREKIARFLGVLINENLTWNDHISAIKAKMSRYVGVLYKLKKLLPLSARKNIFHSFVQSHLNFVISCGAWVFKLTLSNESTCAWFSSKVLQGWGDTLSHQIIIY